MTTERDDAERVDELLSRLPPPAPLTPTQVARIRANIDVGAKPAFARGVRRAGILGVMLLGTGALAHYLLRSDDSTAPVGTPADAQVASPPEPAPPLSPAPPAVELPAVTARAPEPTRAPAEPLPVPRPIAKSARPSAPASEAPPARARSSSPVEPSPVVEPLVVAEPPESALGAESRLLGAALRQLRQQRDPAGALDVLDRYDAQFPRGVLAFEARAARIEALLATGNKRAALRVLDAGSVTPELAVVRGELRLEAGRVEEAARDFTSALVGTADDLEQRALFGRAACRIRLGDEVGATRDLEDYLRRFPNGRSAAAAKNVLERIR